MILPGKENDFGRHSVMLQSAEPLLALLDGDAEVVVGMKNQRGSANVAYVFKRRGIPVLIKVVEEDAFEVVFVAISAVARAVIADEIGNRAQSHSGFESVGVGNDPVGHVAAVAPA